MTNIPEQILECAECGEEFEEIHLCVDGMCESCCGYICDQED